jgi:hypothetical protein
VYIHERSQYTSKDVIFTLESISGALVWVQIYGIQRVLENDVHLWAEI